MDLIDIGPVFEAAGYAEVNRNIVLHLHRLGVNIRVRLRALGSTRVELDHDTRALLEKMVQNVHITRAIALVTFLGGFLEREPGCHSIGLTMLETDRIPQDWVARCNLMDEVWVPSRFNSSTFTASGVDAGKVHVMPLGIDESRFHPGLPPLPIAGRRGFTFLSVFEWIPRKGYDILLRAFLSEFGPREDVCLVLRAHDNSAYDPGGARIKTEIAALCRALGREDGPQVIVLPALMSIADMARLYAAADCFVLPTRGEGWNMTAMEAMACGVPVICTNWSAHLDFMTADNGLLIDVERLEPVPAFGIANDRVYAGSRWARPSEAHLRKLMRWAYENRARAREIGARGSRDVLGDFTWEKAARRMYARLLEIEQKTSAGLRGTGDETPPQGPPNAPGAALSRRSDSGPEGTGGGRPLPPQQEPRAGRVAVPVIRSVPPPPPRKKEISRDGRYRGDGGSGLSDTAVEGHPDHQAQVACSISMVVPSWGKRCGISGYSRSLVDHLEAFGVHAEVVPSGSADVLLDFFQHRREHGREGEQEAGLGPRLDLVHFQYEFVLYDIDDLASVVGFLHDLGVPAVATAHDFAPGLARHNGFVARVFSRLIVHSQEARNAYCRIGADPGRVVVLPMGCTRYPPDGGSRGEGRSGGKGEGADGDRDEVAVRAQMGVGPGPAVGFFGFCLPHKGMLELAMAVQAVRRVYPSLKCFMFSSVAPYPSSRAFAAHLRETVARLRLSDAVVLVDDYLPEAEAVRLLHAMDVNVLPYRDHGLIGTSAAARTVMAAEKPMIVTCVPFFSDLGPEVYRIPSSHPEKIAKALLVLLGDRELRETLRMRMRESLRRGDWSNVARQHAALYRRVLDESRAAPGGKDMRSGMAGL